MIRGGDCCSPHITTAVFHVRTPYNPIDNNATSMFRCSFPLYNFIAPVDHIAPSNPFKDEIYSMPSYEKGAGQGWVMNKMHGQLPKRKGPGCSGSSRTTTGGRTLCRPCVHKLDVYTYVELFHNVIHHVVYKF